MSAIFLDVKYNIFPLLTIGHKSRILYVSSAFEAHKHLGQFLHNITSSFLYWPKIAT